ncbi:MAG: hypothetical protein ACI837_003330 [Crocinitomicaceae bacterium]|jgi:hypothetical protein
MKKLNLLLSTLAICAGTIAFSQNVGIGTATPVTKLNVVQLAAVIGIEVDHAGAAGNSIVAYPQNVANASSAIWVLNPTAGRGLNIDMLNTGSTTAGARINQTGGGDGLDIFQTNTTGAGQFISLSNATNAFSGSQINHAGTGYGEWINMTNTGAAGTGINIDQVGTGAFSRGIEVGMDAANGALGIASFHNGSGTAIYGSSVGGHAIMGFSDGGLGVYGQSTFITGTGVRGYASGTQSTGGLFQVDNAAADRNSIGAFILYNGSGGGVGGGGNAMEVSNTGTNGNAIDVFIGDPAVAPGPANTANEYACISLAHMGTGTGVLGSKSAVQAQVNGSDPTISAFSNGTGYREGVLSIASPNGFSDPVGVYGYSYTAANAGYGIGVQGVGGWYGVRGIGNGGLAPTTFAVYGSGDYGGTGAKYFSIDHPLDPENKILNHYSVESNEVTNMYRGVVQLDGNGEAIVELPDYFDAANIEPNYQLTSIGSATHPYVLTEIDDNKFTVAGAPNAKVSWTIYAKRNDATLQYFSSAGKNYDQEVVEKPAKMKGKYYTPEAYGQPASKGIHYNAEAEANRIKQETLVLESVTSPVVEKTTQETPADSRTKGKSEVKAEDSSETIETMKPIETK